jgi:hypothetical protein
MTRTTSAIEQASSSIPERGPDGHESTIIKQILQKLSKRDLPEQEQFKQPKTISLKFLEQQIGNRQEKEKPIYKIDHAKSSHD